MVQQFKEVSKLEKLIVRKIGKGKIIPKLQLTSKAAMRLVEKMKDLVYQGSDSKEIAEKLERFIKTLKAGGKLHLVGQFLYSEAGTKNNNFLHYAASRGKYYIAETLIIHTKQYLLNKKNSSGNTPLLNAVSNNKFRVFEMLVENGSNPNIKNIYGDDPLKIAVTGNMLKYADLLLKYKAKVGKDIFVIAEKNKKMLALLKKK